MRNSLLIVISICAISSAEITMPSIFSEGMVLQCDSIVPVWGTAQPYDKIEVQGSWMPRASMTRADAKGVWTAKIKTPPPSEEAYDLSVRSMQEFVIIRNVLSGEVMLFCGDEYLQYPVSMATSNTTQAVGENNPNVRFFTLPERISEREESDVSARWKQAAGMNIGSFSAVAYYFARNLEDQTGKPVGIISATCANSTLESWISRGALTRSQEMLPIVKRLPQLDAYRTEINEYNKLAKAWFDSPETERPVEPSYLDYTLLPTSTFNAMIKPLIPYKVRCAYLYMGLHNIDRAYQYKSLLSLLIEDWRKQWGFEEMPFIIVQIGYQGLPEDARKKLPEMWEAQDEALSGSFNVYSVPAYDIPPENKLALSNRLLIRSYSKLFGQTQIVGDGPVFKMVRSEKNTLRLFFDNVLRGFLTQGSNQAKGFEIAGIDRIFYPATAMIERNTIVLSSPEVRNPVAARYGWNLTEETSLPNLANRSDLPMHPFRTDRWDYKTKGNE
ncbi:MAG: hypothetical protein AB7F23_03390 [Phycisphaerae bacterium]|jgi:sialate O-acetylesterase